ncbi:uncharacterized protein LOC122623201 [Drosophila teissieri]|uniref:uncharacterized protein LOC122623201 n=1 Tax=Drosophila teissieri TaxID=7243 RepID=UPI001CBA10A4|nr:uncharacterized protein LOC122623201 [Drosophila teissieri]
MLLLPSDQGFDLLAEKRRHHRHYLVIIVIIASGTQCRRCTVEFLFSLFAFLSSLYLPYFRFYKFSCIAQLLHCALQLRSCDVMPFTYSLSKSNNNNTVARD